MTKNDDKSDDKTSGGGSRIPDLIPTTTRLTDNKLNGSNFFEWSKTVRLYIRGMGMASHLTSDPPTNVNQDLWLQQDVRLLIQIINSIKPRIFGNTCFVRDTRPCITKLDPKSLKCVFSWLF